MNVLYYIINTDIEPDLPKGAIRRILPSGRASRSIPAALSSGGNPGAVDWGYRVNIGRGCGFLSTARVSLMKYIQGSCVLQAD